MPADKVSFYNCIDMGIFICFMDICLGHSGIDFDKILYPDTGEDKEYVLNAKYRLDLKIPVCREDKISPEP